MPRLWGSRVAIHCIEVVVCGKIQPRSPPVAVSPGVNLVWILPSFHPSLHLNHRVCPLVSVLHLSQ